MAADQKFSDAEYKEALHTLDVSGQYFRANYAEPLYQWEAWNDDDQKIFTDAGQRPIFDAASINELEPQDLDTAAQRTGYITAYPQYRSTSDPALAYMYGWVLKTKATIPVTPKLFLPAAEITRHAQTALDLQKQLDRADHIKYQHEVQRSSALPSAAEADCMRASTWTTVMRPDRNQVCIPWYQRPFLEMWKGSLCKYESAAENTVKLIARHLAALQAVRGLVGFPQLATACLSKRQLTTEIIYVQDTKTQQMVSSLCHLAFLSTKLQPLVYATVCQQPEYRKDEKADAYGLGLRFSREAQEEIALKLRNTIRMLHSLGWTHNFITPESIQIDPIAHMRVYLTNLQYAFPVEEAKTALITDESQRKEYGAPDAASAPELADDPFGFDWYSAWMTFTAMKMGYAADLIARVPVQPTDTKSNNSLTNDYSGAPVWHKLWIARMKKLGVDLTPDYPETKLVSLNGAEKITVNVSSEKSPGPTVLLGADT